MRRLRIFISSPGDVQKERQVARSIIGRLVAEFADIVALDPYFWEYEPMRVTADFQTQIAPPSDFDIVVCILWSRLGTPLQAPDGRRYQSGTEYEVNTAIAAYRARGSPDVLVYHSQTPAEIRRAPKEAREHAYRQLEALEVFLDRLALDPQTGAIKGAIIRYSNLAEFEERVEEHLRKLIVGRVGELPPDEVPRRSAPAWSGSPFRGLELFDFEHAAIFFGRTRAIGDIVDRLRRQAARLAEQGPAVEEGTAIFLLVSAMSGAGKSSLVRAGVLPLLTRPGVIEGIGLWRRAIMLPSTSSGDLFDSLAVALIARLLRRPSDLGRSLTVIDQNIGRAARAISRDRGVHLVFGARLIAPPVGRLQRRAEPRPQDADDDVGIRRRRNLGLKIRGDPHRLVFPEIGIERDDVGEFGHKTADDAACDLTFLLNVARREIEDAQPSHAIGRWAGSLAGEPRICSATLIAGYGRGVSDALAAPAIANVAPRSSAVGCALAALKPERRHHVGRRRLPALRRPAVGDGAQFARENFAPEDDAGVGTAEPLALAVLDAALPGLHGDVLHDGEVGMRHVGKAQLAGPESRTTSITGGAAATLRSYSARLAR